MKLQDFSVRGAFDSGVEFAADERDTGEQLRQDEERDAVADAAVEHVVVGNVGEVPAEARGREESKVMARMAPGLAPKWLRERGCDGKLFQNIGSLKRQKQTL